VHIEEVNDVLHIYIPRDHSDRRRCYNKELPQSLGRYFGLKMDSTVSLTFASVFFTPGDLIDECLDSHGIVRISPDIALQPESEPTDTTISDGSIEGGDVFSGSDDAQESGEGMYTPQDTSGSTPEGAGELPRTIITHNRASAPLPRPFTVPYPDWPSPDGVPRPFAEHHPYIQLLDKVIRLARPLTLSEVLQRPMITVGSTANTSHESTFGVRSENQLAHDIKIGAAGELFVRQPSTSLPLQAEVANS
jgi:hypothetical protein